MPRRAVWLTSLAVAGAVAWFVLRADVGEAPLAPGGTPVPQTTGPAPHASADSDGEARITVVGAGGRPLAGATVHVRRTAESEFHDHVGAGPGGVAVLDASVMLSEDDRYDLVVTCDGHRSAVVRDVRGSRTVTLAPTTPHTVRVRLAEGVPLPEPPYRLDAWLEWHDPDGRDDPRRAEPRGRSGFASDRVLRFEVHDPGTWVVGFAETASAAAVGMPQLPPETRSGHIRFAVPYPALVEVPEDAAPVEIVIEAISDRKQR